MLRRISSRSAASRSFPRLTGFARDVVIGRDLGAGPVDRPVLALRLPNHFRAIFGEGAFNAAFVPAYAPLRETAGAAFGAQLSPAGLWTILMIAQLLLLASAGRVCPSVVGCWRRASAADPRRIRAGRQR